MKALIQKHDGYTDTPEGPFIDAAGDWLEMVEIDQPKAGEGQALIRVVAASVNPSDLHFIKGEYGQPRVKGAVAGFEGVGIVEEGPKHLKGNRVAFVAGPNGSGAWAECAVADAHSCIPLADGISDHDGAGQIVNPLTASAMMNMAAEHGDAVVITGANSQLGKLMIDMAPSLGLTVVATVRREEAADALRDRGVEHVLVTTSENYTAQAAAASRAVKPRMILDCVGDQAVEIMFSTMPNRSRWVNYGKVSREMPVLNNLGQLIFMSKQIEGFWLTKWFATADLATQMKAVQGVQMRFLDGTWKTDVSAVVKLENVMDELANATKIKDGKVIIEI